MARQAFARSGGGGPGFILDDRHFEAGGSDRPKRPIRPSCLARSSGVRPGVAGVQVGERPQQAARGCAQHRSGAATSRGGATSLARGSQTAFSRDQRRRWGKDVGMSISAAVGGALWGDSNSRRDSLAGIARQGLPNMQTLGHYIWYQFGTAWRPKGYHRDAIIAWQGRQNEALGALESGTLFLSVFWAPKLRHVL